jgi:hypothetical protein
MIAAQMNVRMIPQKTLAPQYSNYSALARRLNAPRPHGISTTPLISQSRVGVQFHFAESVTFQRQPILAHLLRESRLAAPVAQGQPSKASIRTMIPDVVNHICAIAVCQNSHVISKSV